MVPSRTVNCCLHRLPVLVDCGTRHYRALGCLHPAERRIQDLRRRRAAQGLLESYRPIGVRARCARDAPAGIAFAESSYLRQPHVLGNRYLDSLGRRPATPERTVRRWVPGICCTPRRRSAPAGLLPFDDNVCNVVQPVRVGPLFNSTSSHLRALRRYAHYHRSVIRWSSSRFTSRPTVLLQTHILLRRRNGRHCRLDDLDAPPQPGSGSRDPCRIQYRHNSRPARFQGQPDRIRARFC